MIGFVIVITFVFPEAGMEMLDKIRNNDEVTLVNNPVINNPVVNNDNPVHEEPSDDYLSLANWNLQIFGISKASDQELMNDYASIISDYDIVFIQEIRDSSGTAFNQLCSLMNGYTCEVSSRAGRTQSKEQYGIIYKNYISLENFVDYNPDSLDRWERPPVKATFNVNNYTFSVYNLHAKPSEVQMELRGLQNIVSNNGNEVIIGDLNADCTYYDAYYGTEFDSWNWVISDYEDTTVSSTDCAYDRIILNDDAYEEYVSSGIRTQGITSDHSDHYLVYAEIMTTEV